MSDGAVADLCKELARDSQGAGKPAANENLESMVVPTVFPTANLFLRLMPKLTKLCSSAGFSKNIDKGQFFITLDDDTLDSVKTSCREYVLLRSMNHPR